MPRGCGKSHPRECHKCRRVNCSSDKRVVGSKIQAKKKSMSQKHLHVKNLQFGHMPKHIPAKFGRHLHAQTDTVEV